MTSLLPDPQFKLDQLSPDFIKKNLCNVSVQVEKVGEDGNYGTSQKRLEMTLGSFLERVERREGLYLSTQYEKDDGEGFLFDKSPIKEL